MKITKDIPLIILKIPRRRVSIIVKLNLFRRNSGNIYIQETSLKLAMMSTYLVIF
jgi:hypothetical protein